MLSVHDRKQRYRSVVLFKPLTFSLRRKRNRFVVDSQT